jgi:hypothetical protein
MSEIEKCVCGGNPHSDGEWVSCSECGREGEVFAFWTPNGREKSIQSWNHDMRGLRLLRELLPPLDALAEETRAAWERPMSNNEDLEAANKAFLSHVDEIRIWAEEDDR